MEVCFAFYRRFRLAGKGGSNEPINYRLSGKRGVLKIAVLVMLHRFFDGGNQPQGGKTRIFI